MKLSIVFVICSMVAWSCVAGENCGRNMKFHTCGNPCERTCRHVAEHRPSALSCVRMCAPPACYCKSGFVRSYDGASCVTESQCFLAKKK